MDGTAADASSSNEPVQIPAVAAGRLTVEVRDLGSAVVVAPVGELDHDTADVLRERLDICLSAEAPWILVDCRELSFCDSTGLNLLLATRSKAESSGTRISLAELHSTISRLFELTGVDAVFEIYSTVDEAVRS
ncbi:anti-anti-sigma factor [Streptacidiphilus sp. MAP12-16]|uniref:STAS domain-containing protein n=1 Tax=Streptacidiphilus sp. MAP12-16 TaxID=3156300 RepID=UPI0035139C4F